jgi:hypothetical protein
MSTMQARNARRRIASIVAFLVLLQGLLVAVAPAAHRKPSDHRAGLPGFIERVVCTAHGAGGQPSSPDAGHAKCCILCLARGADDPAHGPALVAWSDRASPARPSFIVDFPPRSAHAGSAGWMSSRSSRGPPVLS